MPGPRRSVASTPRTIRTIAGAAALVLVIGVLQFLPTAGADGVVLTQVANARDAGVVDLNGDGRPDIAPFGLTARALAVGEQPRDGSDLRLFLPFRVSATALDTVQGGGSATVSVRVRRVRNAAGRQVVVDASTGGLGATTAASTRSITRLARFTPIESRTSVDVSRVVRSMTAPGWMVIRLRLDPAAPKDGALTQVVIPMSETRDPVNRPVLTVSFAALGSAGRPSSLPAPSPPPAPAPAPQPAPGATLRVGEVSSARTGDIPSPCDGVHVPSGASIQSAIDGNVAGTTFCLTGKYVLASALVAKTGDRFIGPATIDGQYTTPQAFAGRDRTIKNVTVRGLTVQHFNPALQRAALDEAPGTGWVIDSNDVSFNSTGGIEAWTGDVVTGNQVHDNGQLGIRGFQSTGSLVTKNEVYRNNVVVAGFPTSGTFGQGWESGGMKFAKTTNLTISNNNVHDNIGNAIWLDTDDVGYMVKNNVVSNNSHHGIFIELDQAGTVADNIVSKSGFLPPSPYGGAGMRVAGSTGVTMTGNSVTCSQGGNYSYINGSTVIDGGGNTSHGC